MRIRVIQKPRESCIDGIQLDRFMVGIQYEVGNLIGALLLSEGWAEPVASEEAAVLIPLTEFEADRSIDQPKNLTRELFPPYYDTLAALAADRQKKPRRPRHP